MHTIDPFTSGINAFALKQRARAQWDAAQAARDPMEKLRSPIATYNEQWGPWFLAVQEAAEAVAGPDAKVAFGQQFGAGPSDTNQLRGGSAQPGATAASRRQGMSPSIADDPQWWLQGEAPTNNLQEIEQRAKRMPASLHGLYAADLKRGK